ncbi:hypothetical protein SAMN05428976_10855 [Clostridium sp. USBA 49]|uniref:hypothetical protein n=1 Tax=Clostridium sp. USBA 49 TaxID=1881060 RepID=UPI00099ADA19|nr:hypothetical protein [Clostridium sp. USBA 49]SKA86220.1 hypothetical protein SAMN05428976_10855 [Clostridium sp. USBA 49]
MKNILDKLSYYFKDSYGLDKLTKYLFILGLLLSFSKYTSIAGVVLIFYGLFRTFSKNKYKRHQELSVFENYLLILKQRYYRFKSYIKDSRKYKIFKCPNCSQKLRVPRKKGKIIITCKKCGIEFKGKS